MHSRVFYGTEDLIEYFDDLEKANKLPDLDGILTDATTLVDRYASQAALQNSLRASDATNISNPNPVPVGSPWVARGSSSSPTDSSQSKLHREHAGFTGDRVLRNSEVFLMEFGWWNEMAWAVPEGDIGRVWEIFKVSSNPGGKDPELKTSLDLDLQICWLVTPKLHEIPPRILLPLALRVL
jgi:hypothetical protein